MASELIFSTKQRVFIFFSGARISSAGKGSVFEDNVVAFKEEDTPVE